MKKHLTENEISLAREIFVSLAVQHKTQDFNKQMASASIRMARLFSQAVEDENADCENFNIRESELLQPSKEVKQHLHAKYFGFDVGESDSCTRVNPITSFNQMVCGFEKFDIFGPLHKSKYEKNEVLDGTITCNVFNVNGIEDNYIAHTYPDWVVAKFTDKYGIVWGANSDEFQYEEGLGIWIANNPNPKLKFAVLMYEKCTVAPRESLVSIDLPF